MAANSSTTFAIGSPLPAFELPDTATGATVASHGPPAPATLVTFVCNHCPYVVHIRDAVVKLGNQAARDGVRVFAINANSTRSHPQDGPEAMRALAQEASFAFPFLFDETQEVARAFNAACTPEFYLFDRERRLAYHGQFDDSRPGNGKPVTGRDLSDALTAVLRGEAPAADQKPAVGCSIKWHPAA